MSRLSLVRGNRVGLLAVLVMACSIFYSGLLKPIDARDIDARYFYVAARCWAAGESPYDATIYKARYRAVFGSEPEALFVAYLPTLMPVILPLAPLDWGSAARLFEVLNFSAAMLLLWACFRLIRDLLGAPLGVSHWAWLTLGITLGGVSATISTGQTSLLVAAACAVALLGCRLRRTWMVIAGAVIASAKPHLSAPILLFILLFEPAQRKSLIMAGGIILAFIAYAAALDGNFVANYLGSIRTYNAISNNDPRLQIGLSSFLARTDLSGLAMQVLGVVALALSLTVAGLLGRRTMPEKRSKALALILVVFSVGMAHSIQAYDVCIYSLGIALCSMLSRRLQLVCLVPALLLWRPTVPGRFIQTWTAAGIADLGWLLVIAACLYAAARMLAARPVRTEAA